MKKIFVLLALGILLESCTPILDAGSPGTAIINNCMIDNQAEALDLAQQHCQQYGKNAVKIPDDRPDGICTYECKAP